MELMNKKYLIFLMGGIGNNLFQLALGEHLKCKGANVRYHLGLTKRSVLTGSLGWSIHDARLRDCIFSDEECTDKWRVRDLAFIIWSLLKKKCANTSLLEFGPEILRRGLFAEKSIVGYWQYGDHLNQQVINRLRERIGGLFPSDGIKRGVVVHYRGGDFKPNARITEHYYKNAFRYVRGSDIPTVLSNDPSFAARLAESIEIPIANSNTNDIVEDFIVLLNADTVICSNSTFCHWGAALGRARNVIVPSRVKVGEEWAFRFYFQRTIVIDCYFESEVLQEAQIAASK